jgi:hypothetical protein
MARIIGSTPAPFFSLSISLTHFGMGQIITVREDPATCHLSGLLLPLFLGVTVSFPLPLPDKNFPGFYSRQTCPYSRIWLSLLAAWGVLNIKKARVGEYFPGSSCFGLHGRL